MKDDKPSAEDLTSTLVGMEPIDVSGTCYCAPAPPAGNQAAEIAKEASKQIAITRAQAGAFNKYQIGTALNILENSQAELAGQIAGLVRIAAGEQPIGQHGRVDAPRGVEPRPQAEADGRGVDLAPPQPGFGHEGLHTGPGVLIQLCQAAAHQGPEHLEPVLSRGSQRAGAGI